MFPFANVSTHAQVIEQNSFNGNSVQLLIVAGKFHVPQPQAE